MNYTDSILVIREPVNILLVDDQPAKLLKYQTILSDLGEKLFTANSASEAMELVLKLDVAVVLVNACLSETNGFELASAIRKHPRCQKTAIILISASDQTDLDRVKGYDCGAMDYISVPIVSEIMRAKVSVFVDLFRKTRDVHRLNAKLQRQAQLLDQSYDAIFAWRFDSGIVYWNKAAEQLYGYTAAEARGRVSHELLATECSMSHSELVDLLQQKTNWAGELVHRHRDGRRLMIESRMRMVRYETESLVLEVNRDITQRKAMEREVLDVVAQEQQRIGQELHDGVNQELFALNLISTAMSLRLSKVAPTEVDHATKIVNGLTRVQQQIRALARGLVPVELDPRGLLAALRELAERTSEHSSVVCQFDQSGSVQIEDRIVSTHLIRIAQEAVRNAVRHGQPRNILLSLTQSSDRIVLSITDDGAGLRFSGNEPTGLGIKLMQHRASVIGGWLTVGSATGGGTIVTCTLPTKNQNGGLEAASPKPSRASHK